MIGAPRFQQISSSRFLTVSSIFAGWLAVGRQLRELVREKRDVGGFEFEGVGELAGVKFEEEGVRAGGEVGDDFTGAADGFAVEPGFGGLHALQAELDVAAPGGLESRGDKEWVAAFRQWNFGVHVLLAKDTADGREHWRPIL